MPRKLKPLTKKLKIPELPELVSRFLYEQANPDSLVPANLIPIEELPQFMGKVLVYPSAISVFHTPSDMSGTRNMCCERIRSISSWRNGPERRDCIYVVQDKNLPGFRGLLVAQVHAFIRIKPKHIRRSQCSYLCAIVSWFKTVGDMPCPNTGMWIIQRELEHGKELKSIIHIDTILRGAHLIGIAADSFIPGDLEHTDSLNAFKTFFVNKYIDYHAHEMAF
jgi:hypothetical protein